MEFKNKGIVSHVADGDTIHVNADLGYTVHFEPIIRLARINANELHDTDPVKRARAVKARDYLLANYMGTTVYLDSKKKDNRGRWIAEVYLNPDFTNSLSDVLVKLDMADYETYK